MRNNMEKVDACIFCQIVAGELPATFVYEGENVLAFENINPKAPVHVLIIPRTHITSMNEVTTAQDELVGRMFHAAREVAVIKGVDQTGYQLLIRTGRDGRQEVGHMHLHVTGGKELAENAG